MEFIIISLFIFIVVAGFALIRDLRREDHKRETIQKLFDDNI
jgi:large-conductance mechanosensitive channel